MMERWVALLGRSDSPTDAVEDYCLYLADALKELGVSLELARVQWQEKGWQQALREIRRNADGQPGCWFLLQYTALSWSRRGFPLRVPKLVRFLKKRGARCAMVFHDANPYAGNRILDRIRRALQIYAMQQALRWADLAVLTIPPEKVPWVPSGSRNVAFIPVGANLPSPEKAWSVEKSNAGGAATLCVFSVAPGAAAHEEVELIAQTVRYASQKTGKLRLLVVGRNSDIAGRHLQRSLSGESVEIVVLGILTGEEIVKVLGSCHAMLFSRGQISSRRSSAIAGIACGLPVIAPGGPETTPPVTEAGVVLVPAGARDQFGPALVRVLTDAPYREELAMRSRQAQRKYFSWRVISSQYVKFLRQAETAKE